MLTWNHSSVTSRCEKQVCAFCRVQSLYHLHRTFKSVNRETIRCHLPGCSLTCTPWITDLESILFPDWSWLGVHRESTDLPSIAKGHTAEVWLSNAMPFCGVWTACIVFPSHRLLVGREALRSRIRRIALTAVLKGNHTDNSVQWPSLLRLRHQHLWYCINKTTGISPCDGPRTQREMQEKAFSPLTTSEALLFPDKASQGELCLCRDGIIIHWTKAQSMLLWCHDSTLASFGCITVYPLAREKLIHYSLQCLVFRNFADQCCL